MRAELSAFLGAPVDVPKVIDPELVRRRGRDMTPGFRPVMKRDALAPTASFLPW